MVLVVHRDDLQRVGQVADVDFALEDYSRGVGVAVAERVPNQTAEHEQELHQVEMVFLGRVLHPHLAPFVASLLGSHQGPVDHLVGQDGLLVIRAELVDLVDHVGQSSSGQQREVVGRRGVCLGEEGVDEAVEHCGVGSEVCFVELLLDAPAREVDRRDHLDPVLAHAGIHFQFFASG